MNAAVQSKIFMLLVCFFSLGLSVVGCSAQDNSPEMIAAKPSEVRGDLVQVAHVLWGRGLTESEIKQLVKADDRLRETDLLQYFSRWRQYDETLNSLKLVGQTRPSQLQFLRHRHGAILYFDKAMSVGADDFAALKKSLSGTDPLLEIMLQENPVVLEDHDARVLVTEDHMQAFEKAITFFGRVCDAPQVEIEEARDAERAGAIANFNKTPSKNREFFAITPAQITAQMEAWKIAPDDAKQRVRESAKAKYKESGFWGFRTDLKQLEKSTFHNKMIHPNQRVAEFPTFFLVNTEVEWAAQLVESGIGVALDNAQRQQLQEVMIEDFKKFANGDELNALARSRQGYLNAQSPASRSGYRLSNLRAMWRADAVEGALGNFLTRLKLARPIELDEKTGMLITDWHLESVAKWMQMVSWLADAPQPTLKEIKLQQNHFVTLFKTDPPSRYFLDNYPLFVDDALRGWTKSSSSERTKLRSEAKQLYAKYGLASAALPLSQVSKAEQKLRIEQNLKAFGDKLIEMQIQQMQQQMIFQAHAGVLNTLSEVGATMSAGPDASIWGGGGSGLIIDGNIHQYPVPQTFIAGQYSFLASMAKSSKVVFETEIKKANDSMVYFGADRSIVAGGALQGFDKSALPELSEAEVEAIAAMKQSKLVRQQSKEKATTKATTEEQATKMDVAKPMIQPEKAKQPKQQLANGPQLGSVQYKTWTQNQLTHPDGVEFIEPGKESPRRVFKFSTGSLEKSSSKKFADWGETTEDKLMQALSVAAVDLVETTFAGGVLSGEAMTEHGDCTFSAEFRNDQTEVFILIKPAND